MKLPPPRGLLVDYGGTLVEELEYHPRAGIELLLSRASHCSPNVSIDAVLERADRVSRDVAGQRDGCQIETPWPALTRLIHDFFGTQFAEPLSELELAFWNASVRTRAMPGVLDALRECQQAGLPMGVVSNSSFGQHVIRHELAKHALSCYIEIVVVSAEYVVRKPNPLLFETAAAMLGVAPRDVWFVGDRLETDIAGARSAGMTTIWFAPSDAVRHDEVDCIASSWEAFRAILRSACEG